MRIMYGAIKLGVIHGDRYLDHLKWISFQIADSWAELSTPINTRPPCKRMQSSVEHHISAAESWLFYMSERSLTHFRHISFSKHHSLNIQNGWKFLEKVSFFKNRLSKKSTKINQSFLLMILVEFLLSFCWVLPEK